LNNTIITCHKCGTNKDVIKANNDFASDICITCINKLIDYNNMKQFGLFCRTMNLPFSPNLYMSLTNSFKDRSLLEYVRILVDDDEFEYSDRMDEIYNLIKEEWDLVRTHRDFLGKLALIKDDFIDRSKTKWDGSYTFEEFLSMEDTFIKTIKLFNIDDPIRINLVKMVCKLEQKINKEINFSEDDKGLILKGLIDSQQKILKAAKLNDSAELAKEGTISTVSDLYFYMEKNGFKFTFYDNVERDIVDKTMADIKKILVDTVVNATGLETMMEEMRDAYRRTMEMDQTDDVLSQMPIDDLVEEYKNLEEEELDSELEDENIETLGFDDAF